MINADPFIMFSNFTAESLTIIYYRLLILNALSLIKIKFLNLLPVFLTPSMSQQSMKDEREKENIKKFKYL